MMITDTPTSVLHGNVLDPRVTESTAETFKTSERSIWRCIAAGRLKTHLIRVSDREIARTQTIAAGET